ncbi:unnamed protein product [Pseudo-nitzschia multistriata]|uniref:Uncharacterized protein n=1 Tax=Pseudo-nitzschia multistriata TaxID=183589 RepID=A0A448ZNH6_9STRA|nr:unnamed protein product [Pseudo-nitzschia multistriata]
MSSSEKDTKEAREFASAVLTGTVIGRTLQDALRSLSEEDSDDHATDEYATKSDGTQARADGIDEDTEDGGDGDGVQDEKCAVRMDSQSMNRILKSFQEAVVESRLCHKPDNGKAPRGLLKGRCDYFNRYGQNWMVLMDEVQIKARPQKFTKRRRDDRPSLWDRDDDKTAKTTKKEIVVKEKMQLLAYGDIS